MKVLAFVTVFHLTLEVGIDSRPPHCLPCILDMPGVSPPSQLLDQLGEQRLEFFLHCVLPPLQYLFAHQ